MLDRRTNICPDMYWIISSFKIDWSKIPAGKKWQYDVIHLAILEVYKYDHASGSFYDRHNSTLTVTTKVINGLPKSNVDHSFRSKLLHHPNVISKKQNDMTAYMQVQRSK